MKTQKENRLNFTKNSVVELNDGQMADIDGGTTAVCVATAASSVACVAIFVVAVGVSYAIGHGGKE